MIRGCFPAARYPCGAYRGCEKCGLHECKRCFRFFLFHELEDLDYDVWYCPVCVQLEILDELLPRRNGGDLEFEEDLADRVSYLVLLVHRSMHNE